MAVTNWTDADSNRANEIWAEYQQQHDVSDKVGQTERQPLSQLDRRVVVAAANQLEVHGEGARGEL